MLLAYGFPEEELNDTLSRSIMAYTLLRRFINIPELLRLFEPQRPETFEELKNKLWLLKTVL